MDIVTESVDFMVLLAKINSRRKDAIVRDNIDCTWSIWYDVDYWANTVARPIMSMEEEILEPEIIIQQANIQWFFARRPLAVLWKPESTIII